MLNCQGLATPNAHNRGRKSKTLLQYTTRAATRPLFEPSRRHKLQNAFRGLRPCWPYLLHSVQTSCRSVATRLDEQREGLDSFHKTSKSRQVSAMFNHIINILQRKFPLNNTNKCFTLPGRRHLYPSSWA